MSSNYFITEWINCNENNSEWSKWLWIFGCGKKLWKLFRHICSYICAIHFVIIHYDRMKFRRCTCDMQTTATNPEFNAYMANSDVIKPIQMQHFHAVPGYICIKYHHLDTNTQANKHISTSRYNKTWVWRRYYYRQPKNET